MYVSIVTAYVLQANSAVPATVIGFEPGGQSNGGESMKTTRTTPTRSKARIVTQWFLRVEGEEKKSTLMFLSLEAIS